MSDIFKLKVCIGNANIELEGEGNLVHTIFSELREEGLGKLSDSVPVELKNDASNKGIGNNIPCEEKNNIETLEPQIKEAFKLPQINTIVIKNLPKTEAEWIVVYALYVSEQGTKIFGKEELRQLYQDSGRFHYFCASCLSALMISCYEYFLINEKTSSSGIFRREDAASRIYYF